MGYKKVSGNYRFSETAMRIEHIALYVNDIEGAQQFFDKQSTCINIINRQVDYVKILLYSQKIYNR